ncbi:protein phosphatase 2C domain-containing protein [Actinokineospora auranticolor]|uniref:Serine/threonine protein phosphatase PrpC n=1 Tax=Actinokineospora auranticolor TaxID=155976 RepID=A0A2S6GBL1_9PSEU|nr:protein phosphatase 2C domain-containing protein [Actinokineospora auranticolor]PPK61480.1 serine/threonine protein phosphatase PrpC [Actinokineospora auranticolor]
MLDVVRAVAMTARGRVRDGNEDAVSVFGWFSQSAEPLVVDLRADGRSPLLCAVADGMGGHAAGEVASATALVTAADRYLDWTGAKETAVGLTGISAELNELGNRVVETTGMGTTIAGVVITPGSVLCFNIGDSRVYQVADDGLAQLTVDDAITGPCGGLTQAMGDPPDPGPLPHVLDLELAGASTRFLLCSDGVSSVLTPDEIADLSRIPDPVDLVTAIRDTVYDFGAPDNLTAVVLDIPGR